VNLFRACQENIDALLDKLEWRLHSREELQAANLRMQNGGGDALQRAADFFLVHRTCFRGVHYGAFGGSPTTPIPSRSAKLWRRVRLLV
jgi:site-specific DNA-adenine methylase